MIRVIIVEDNYTIREGLKTLIDGTEGYSCLAVYSDCESLIKNINNHQPDVILMDIGLPGMSGIDGIKILKDKNPDLTILVITVYEENELVFQALCAGACGYLVKKTSPSRLLDAIKEASEGGAPMTSHIARKVVNFFQKKEMFSPSKQTQTLLTPREKEVLSGLIEGNSYQAIADTLFISVETVRFHFRNIYKKLHVHSQSEAVAKALKEGLI